MDYEKSYKEALERARAGKPMNEVFPELHESEDERIRAHVVLVVKDWWRKIAEVTDDGKWPTEEEMLAYLEKQKEKKPSIKEPKYESFEDGNATGWRIKQNPAEWSEDEKIRKQLIDEVKEQINNIPAPDCCNSDDLKRLTILESWLAYLEKQKENPKNADSIPADCVSNAKCENEHNEPGDFVFELRQIISRHRYADMYGECVDDEEGMAREILSLCERQKEQKPSIKEPEYESFEEGNATGWRIKQQPAEWSEEDEKYLNLAINIVASDFGEDSPTVSWLKSIRPQPKREKQIKKGDKVKIHCRKDRKKDMVTTYDGKVGEVIYVWDAQRNPWGHIGVRLDNGCNNGFHEDELEILDEPHWKPSEEQMNALYKVAYNLIGTGTETDVYLVQLYEQLEKL